MQPLDRDDILIRHVLAVRACITAMHKEFIIPPDFA
jgi:hypothetical protein